MPPIGLLATDFDGTLVGTNNPADLDALFTFRDLIRELRTRDGAKWAVITGRHVEAMPELAEQLAIRGLCPDYFVMEDACIYRRSHGSYQAYWWWNFFIDRRRRKQLARYRPRVRQLVQKTLAAHPGAVNLSDKNRLMDFWMRFPDTHSAQEVEQQLLREFGSSPELFIFRWGSEVCLAPTAGTKGEAVAKLARELKLTPANIMAVGDGHNDISMLDGLCAAHPAAVANAAEEVITTVRRAGGYVAQQECVHGVIEFLQRHRRS